jgi:hypothetical protein
MGKNRKKIRRPEKENRQNRLAKTERKVRRGMKRR